MVLNPDPLFLKDKQDLYTSPSRQRVGRSGKARKRSHFVVVTDWKTDRPTDRQTDTASSRVTSPAQILSRKFSKEQFHPMQKCIILSNLRNMLVARNIVRLDWIECDKLCSFPPLLSDSSLHPLFWINKSISINSSTSKKLPCQPVWNK